MLILELRRAEISQRLDEVGKVLGNLLGGLESHGVDGFDLSVYMKLSAPALSYGFPYAPSSRSDRWRQEAAGRSQQHVGRIQAVVAKPERKRLGWVFEGDDHTVLDEHGCCHRGGRQWRGDLSSSDSGWGSRRE